MNWLQKISNLVWFRGRQVDPSQPHIRAQIEEHLNNKWRERILFYNEALTARSSGLDVNQWYRSSEWGGDAAWKENWEELLTELRFHLDDLRTCDVAQSINWGPGSVY